MLIRSFHSIHNVVDCSVLQAMWEELAGQVRHRDQLIICQPHLSENTLYIRQQYNIRIISGPEH